MAPTIKIVGGAQHLPSSRKWVRKLKAKAKIPSAKILEPLKFYDKENTVVEN